MPSVNADSWNWPGGKAGERPVAAQAAPWAPGAPLYKKIVSSLRRQQHAAELAAQQNLRKKILKGMRPRHGSFTSL